MTTRTERERRHQVELQRINQVRCLVGRGDRTRIDHEGTLLERARLLGEELRSYRATEAGLAALDRLLVLAGTSGALHRDDVVKFLLALWRNRPLPLATLRGLDTRTGDDMLAVLDAHRHARVNLVEEVEGGAARVARVLNAAKV